MAGTVGVIDCGELRRAADELTALSHEIHLTYATRDEPGGRDRWSRACAAFHRRWGEVNGPIGDILAGVRAGDAAAVDAAIAYLACDVWHFRSGYLKQEMMTVLAHATPTEVQRRRIGELVLERVDGPARMEFGAVVTLARRTGGRALRDGLRARLRSNDHRVAHRALIVLLALCRPRLTPDDLAAARSIVVAEVRRYVRVGRRGTVVQPVPTWVVRALRLLADRDWARSLLDEAVGGVTVALWLVTRAPVVNSTGADEHLHVRLVEHLVRVGPDLSVDFDVRSGIRLRDGDAIRAMLLGLADDADEMVRRRAEAAWRLLDGG